MSVFAVPAPSTRSNRSPGNRWYRVAILLALTLFAAPGCLRNHLRKDVVRRPARHSLQLDQLLVLSDFKIPQDHRLIQVLQDLRVQIIETLELPPQRDQVVVYLFSDQQSYQQYLDGTWPKLPRRRAYFVGTSRELAVYTFWGNRILEDLRHEYTHGILHASLNAVPLWLDEGLAEYFEVPGEIGGVNVEHATELASAMVNGWSPDLERLESLTDFSDMKRIDYQESWAWVHYMLEGDGDTDDVLRDYLHRLRTVDDAGSLAEKLREHNPAFATRFRAYATGLNSMSAVIRANNRGPEIQ